MRQKQGIGYLKLIIVMILLIIVGFFGVKYVMKEVKKENVKNMQADILLVQAKIELVKGNYNMDKDNNPLKGYNLTQLPEEINLQEFFNNNIISQDEYEKYYLLDSQTLEQVGLQQLENKYNGYFIVNYDDYEVIYTQGYENANGLWCYKISDLNKASQLPDSNNEESENQEKANEESNPEKTDSEPAKTE